MGIILFCFIGNSKGISYEIKGTACRENVPRHILSYCYRKRTGATGLVPTNKVEGQSSRNK